MNPKYPNWGRSKEATHGTNDERGELLPLHQWWEHCMGQPNYQKGARKMDGSLMDLWWIMFIEILLDRWRHGIEEKRKRFTMDRKKRHTWRSSLQWIIRIICQHIIYLIHTISMGLLGQPIVKEQSNRLAPVISSSLDGCNGATSDVLVLFVGVLKAHGQQVSPSFLQLAAFLALLLVRLILWDGIPRYVWKMGKMMGKRCLKKTKTMSCRSLTSMQHAIAA